MPKDSTTKHTNGKAPFWKGHEGLINIDLRRFAGGFFIIYPKHHLILGVLAVQSFTWLSHFRSQPLLTPPFKPFSLDFSILFFVPFVGESFLPEIFTFRNSLALMPTYDYRCSDCGHEFEEMQSMNAEQLTDCPNCGKPALQRLMGGGAGMIFKGSGFYLTDYGKAGISPKKEAAKETKSETSETKSDAKTDSKPAEPAKTKEDTGGKSEKERKDSKGSRGGKKE